MKADCNKPDIFRIVLLAAGVLAFSLLFAFLTARPVSADQIYPEFYSTDGDDCERLRDEDFSTHATFEPGTEITLTSETGMDSLFIRWEQVPGPWTLRAGDQEYTFGENGFLHEYVELPDEVKGTGELTIVADPETLEIADIFAFSKGTLPAFVQDWQAPYEEADVLFISTHADDEVLFLGDVIITLADRGDVSIQVAYFNEYSSGREQSDPVRSHEILNGLWTMGVTHYPQMGEFFDAYMNTVEDAETIYGRDASLEYIVRTIRRFKPLVIVTQDPLNGEYGHGSHMWVARMVQEAVDITNDPNRFPESADRYGTWEPQKVYFHLYPENPIELDARVPLASFGGRNALEVAEDAYREHLSQQWTDFIVSDGYDDNGYPNGYEYSCTKYGLYKTLVGPDVNKNDILENVVTYEGQEKARQEEEAARLAKEAEEAEKARIAAEEEERARVAAELAAERMKTHRLIIIVLALAVFWTFTILLLSASARRYRRRKRDQELRRKENKFRQIQL